MSRKKHFPVLPVVLAAFSAAGVYYLLTILRGSRPGGGEHVTAVALAMAAAAVSLFSAFRFNRSVTMAASELDSMAASSELGSLDICISDPGLQQVITPVNRLLARCENEIKQAQDQNRQLQIQNRLSEGEKHNFKSVLDVITDGVFISDNFDELRYLNTAAARHFNLSPESCGHKPIADIIDDRDIVEMIKQTRMKGSSDHRRTIEKSSGSGNDTKIVRYSMHRINSESQSTGGVITVVRDITRESEVVQMKNDFISGVSHELRSPLAGIHAYIEMLRDGEVTDPETCNEFYDIIASQTTRLDRLIDNILNISRIEAGVVKVVPEAMDVTEVVKSIVAIAAPQAREKNIALSEDIAPVFGQVEADRDMLSQAVMNLLSNAIKYTPEGGKVTVSTQVDESKDVVKIAVSDSGVGIPADDIPHLFEKFYRVDGSKNMAKGAGLGLNLVLNIVENLHGGRLTVTSEPGKGSVFTIELPSV